MGNGSRGEMWVVRTLPSTSAVNWACCLDMTGLSNQALSGAAMKPLVETLDARPTVMVLLERVNVRVRLGNKTFPLAGVRAERVRMTVFEGVSVPGKLGQGEAGSVGA